MDDRAILTVPRRRRHDTHCG